MQEHCANLTHILGMAGKSKFQPLQLFTFWLALDFVLAVLLQGKCHTASEILI